MARFPRWLAPPLWAVVESLFYIVTPWAISRLSVRHGWTGGHPSPWQFTGLLLVAGGTALLVWALAEHFRSAPGGWEFELTPRYLLARGPYRYTRNPMYVGGFAIWIGWALFFGSIAVALAAVALWAFWEFLGIPWEERKMSARIGEPYLRYREEVPRWLGKASGKPR
jgi:protein-S-isoprenylcysteine O-methyltransferase Ste14